MLVFRQTAASLAADALRSDVMDVVVQNGDVVGQHGVELGEVDVRLVPVDQRHPVRDHADAARVVGVAVDDARLASDEPCPRCSAPERPSGGGR